MYDAAASLLARGQSRPTLFKLELPENKVERSSADYLNYFVTAITMPGISHDVITSLGQTGLAVQQDIPVAIRFARPLVCTIIENRDMTMYKLFRQLHNETGAQGYNPAANESKTQRMNYYEDFVFDFKLYKMEYPTEQEKSGLDMNNIDYYQPTMEYTFFGGYVTSVGDLSLNTADFDNYLTFDVSFNFETYHYRNKVSTNVVSATPTAVTSVG